MSIKRGLRRPTFPGEILLVHYLRPNDISITRFARAIGCSRKHMSNIVRGNSRVEPGMAAKIAKTLNTSTRFWLHLQIAVDEFDAEAETKNWRSSEPIVLSGQV